MAFYFARFVNSLDERRGLGEFRDETESCPISIVVQPNPVRRLTMVCWVLLFGVEDELSERLGVGLR